MIKLIIFTFSQIFKYIFKFGNIFKLMEFILNSYYQNFINRKIIIINHKSDKTKM